ncbi:hypothetical protein C8F01DRAFT_17912 [Mycena amicta]|nr:hypothetical protein C8F01DRAFT_17912 [Mycena amicta]
MMAASQPVVGTEKADSNSDPQSSDTRSEASDKPALAPTGIRLDWPSSLRWVPDNFTWAQVKPAIRCAIAAWLSAVLFLIPRVEVVLGQAGFLILITAFMSPPNDPFMSVLEREITILIFVTTTWAWSCLGIRLADLARVHRNPAASFTDAVTGQYIEAAPTVIIGIFIFLGSTVLLFIRSRNIPSQIFASILGCLCLGTVVVFVIAFTYTVKMSH